MASFPVKWISSTMRGAPIISGTPGTLIAALDAFLLHGWGQVSASQIVVAAGVATATVNAGDTFVEHAVIEIAGATPTAINGQARVTGGATTTVTWATDAPDGTYTGAITIKYAPVGGWEKPFSKTNVAVYRSTDLASPRMFCRVDDTGTLSARVRGYIDMTDVDTGIGPFPTEAQIAGGGHWVKSGAASATPVAYVLAADSRAVFVAIAPQVSSNAARLSSPLRGFADLIPLAGGGDAFAVGLSCAGDATSTTSASGAGGFEARSSGALAIYMARAPGGVGDAVMTETIAYTGSAQASGADSSLGAFPSAIDGSLLYSRRYVPHPFGGANQPPRADVPGVLHIPQSGVTAQIPRLTLVDGAGALAGRMLLAINVASNALTVSPPSGLCLLDITGPWR